jgi:hypothetical protein
MKKSLAKIAKIAKVRDLTISEFFLARLAILARDLLSLYPVLNSRPGVVRSALRLHRQVVR